MAWEAVAAQLTVRAGVWVYNTFFKKRKRQEPLVPRDIEFPQTLAGTPVPIVYGTVKLDSPVLMWFGNEGGYDDPLADTRTRIYQADMLFALGVPPTQILGLTTFPSITRLWYGEEEFDFNKAHTEIAIVTSTDGTFNVIVEFFDGRADQEIIAYGSPTPVRQIDKALRQAGVDENEFPSSTNQMLMTIRGAVDGETDITSGRLGTDPVIKSVAVELNARGYVPISSSNYDANPAWTLYDLICGDVFKLGYPTAKVDLASFTAVASTLDTEGHGVSVTIATDAEAAEVVSSILDQIDGVLYEAPATGLLTLRLIRADYDPMTVPELTVDNMLGRPKLSTLTWADAANQVEVTYTDRLRKYRTGVATAERMATAIGQDGRPRKRRVDYPYCTDATLAAELAQRELAVMSRPLMTAEVRVTRAFIDLVPGDVVKATWPALGISGVFFRVVDVDQGQLADGSISLALVEDVFGVALEANGVTAPADPPYLLPIWDRLATEAPRWMTGRLAAQSVISDADTYRVLALAANRYDANATAFQTQAPHPSLADLWIKDVPGGAGFRTWGEVAVAYPRTAEPYDTGVGLDITAGGSLPAILTTMIGTTATSVQIGTGQRLCVLYDADGHHEFLAFEAVTGGGASYTLDGVWRGLLDTAPRDWPVGSTLVYLGGNYGGNVGRVGVLEGDALVRWQPYGAASGAGVRVTDTLAVIGRPVLPLPAQDFTVHGNEAEGVTGQGGSGYLKEVTDLDGSLDTDGRPRSRTLGVITRGTSADQGVEVGTTWALVGQRMAAHGFALEEDEIVIVDGLTSPSQVGVLLGKIGHGSLDLKLRTINGAFESWTDPTIRVEAPSFRNLLRNGNAAEGTAGWVQEAQNPLGVAGAAPREWFTSSTSTGVSGLELCSHSQTVDVSGYNPAGLSAVLTFQHRCTSTSGAMLYTVDLIPLDAAGATLAGAATTGSITSQLTLFKTTEISIATLPALTAKLKVVFTTNTSGANLEFTEFRLVLGQQGAQLLTNPTFDT